jgi:hypothetical protein
VALDALAAEPQLAGYSYLAAERADFLRRLDRTAEARVPTSRRWRPPRMPSSATSSPAGWRSWTAEPRHPSPTGAGLHR